MNTKLLKRVAIVSLVMLAAIMGRTQSASYFQAITNLNPAGYWPMHEVEAAAQGDIETNYGTAGLLGTAYYPDWATTANGAGIKRGIAGALANDPDQAVYFTRGASPAAGVFTNCLYIPHASPMSTLNAPFTVECWFYPNNTTSEDIWAQNGLAGLNAGSAGNGNSTGSANVADGIRVVWMNGNVTGFEVFTYKNSASANNAIGFSGVTGQNVSPLNNWYHLVLTCDASTNITLYTNGVVAFTKAAVGLYSPDYWTPITIGGGRGGTRAVSGYVDEFAVYTNVITDINQHYQDGISESQAGVYVSAVLADNPAIYLRMDAPATYTAPAPGTWPALMNYGTAAGNGVYTPGTMPGIMAGPANPTGVPVQGLSGPTVALLGGMSSFADAGSAAIYNPTGSNANFTVTALFRGNPCDNRVQSIMGHGTNSWGLTITTNGCVVFNAGNGNAAGSGTAQAAGDVSSVGVYNDGYWHQVVAVNQINVISLYLDGQLNTNGTPTGITPTSVIQGNALDAMIGADPSYANNPPGAGRQFAGQVCEVAFFTNALTLSQVQGLFNAAGIVPYITRQPVSAGVNQNGAFTNLFTAGGSQPLSYQWYTNGVAFGGQTNASLVLNPVLPMDASTNYYVIVTNNNGSVTSAVVTLTVFSAPTIAAAYPVTYSNVLNTNFMTLYAGASPAFTVLAGGSQPLYYSWFTNGLLDGAAGSSNLLWTNLPAGPLTTYCIVTNSLGSITSIVWSASVIADPTNLAGGLSPYPQSVLALNPIGYWRLNEGNDDGNGDDGYVAHDYAGGNDGMYTNVILGNNGYNPTADPSDASTEFGEFGETIPIVNNYAGQIQNIDFATPNGANAEFTVEAWVNGFPGTGSQILGAAVATKGIYSVNDEFNLGIDSTKEHYRFYIRTANGTVYVVGSGTSPIIDGNWHHVVGVCDEANGVALLYYDGQLVNAESIPVDSGLYEAPNPMTIGAGTGDGINYTYQFNGYINDVAVYNYALNAQQVLAEFVSPGVQPLLTQPPPAAVTTNGYGPLSISATAIGTPPIGYQWYDVYGGTNVATGSTNGTPLNLTLTVSNVPPGWNGDQLELIVTNAYGTTNVFVALDVLTNPPQVTANLPAQVTAYTGGSYNYSIGISGASPLEYQWYQAGAPLAGQTNPTYAVTAGSPGSTTYSVVITNLFGAVTSSVSTFTVNGVPQLTSAYETNVLNLNPVGYWPMHEVESPSPGDMEANYGSLGLLGAGYYPDWMVNSGAFLRGYPGPLPNAGDQGVEFTYPTNDNGALTNSLFVPHTSSLSTLSPPFSVECWFFPTNNNQGDIWSESEDAGLNGGSYANGNGNVCGMRMDWGGTSVGFYVFSYDNNANANTLIQQPNMTLGQWYHLVVTCDANTNVSLFINGGLAATNAAVGQYSPDFWTPFRVGAGNGGSGFRAVAGIISEVAVYTNVLQDISTHYNDASGAPGTYFAAVTNDNPVIYLRMNAAKYVAPNAGTWPLLINYGSVGVNGVYTPGTVPGLVSGPAARNGAPFNGLSGTVPLLSGVSSFADAGYAMAYNPVGPVPYSVAAMFRGNPCDGRFQNIVGHSDSSWRIAMNTDGALQCTLGSNSASVLNSQGIYNDGNWHQVVEVYTPNSNPALPGTNALYVDGALDTAVSTVSTNGIGPGSLSDVLIGSDPQYTNNPVGPGRQFAGQVCEVALFTNALTLAQIQTLNSVAGIAPYITGNPVTGRTFNGGAGSYIYFGALANGSGPLAYQWYFNSSSNYNGATQLMNGVHYMNSTTLQVTVTNLTSADDGYYFVVITNNYGSVTSTLASLTVNTAPAIVSQSAMGNLILYLNQSAALSVTASGAVPLSYQWITNGIPDTTAGTNSSYPLPPAQLAMSGFTYLCVVTNASGSATDALVMLTVSQLPAVLTNSLYGSNVLALKPSVYWPMHEVETAVTGDIETNYGTLGLLGTAYYPDWATLANGAGIKRGAASALANDTDQSVYFIPSSSGSTGPAAGTFTNDLYVPHTSPLSTLSAPFTVECWFYPTNTASQDIWAQAGYEGLNSGGAGNGGGNACGIRLVWENGTTTGFELYTYKNNSSSIEVGFSGVSGQNVSPLDNWYHLVVTCDANTNISLYTNGVLAFSASAISTYSPDYWTPLTIGGGRGGTKAVAGDIDEFAVYTNVIADIAQHFSDGTSESQAGVYVGAVLADNPAIYLRMDAPPVYTPPAVSAWPTLTNYGAFGGLSGVYSPGTMPGLLQGPAAANGAPFKGLSGGNVAQLSGISSFADAGYTAAINPTGSNANFAVTAMFRGNPCDNRVQTIAGHGTNSWQLSIATDGNIVFNAGNGNGAAEGTGQAPGDLSTVGVYNDGNWHQVVAVSSTNVISIYVDGKLDTNGTPSGITPTSVIAGNSFDAMIGADPSYTNNPAGAGRQFAGQVCEVAFFTNVLTASQIGALYLNTATNVAPFFAPAPPASAATSPGGTLVVPATAEGTPPLYYQWQIITNSVTNTLATGSTNGLPLNAALTVGNVPAGWNGGRLELTVTNAYGTNSALVALTIASLVNPNPTNIVLSVTNNQLILSWPADHIGWTLQAQTNNLRVGIGTNWVNVANSQTNNQMIIPINLTNGTVFYRLIYP